MIDKPFLEKYRVRLYPEEVLCLIFFGLLLVLSFRYGTRIKGPTIMVRAMINAFLIVIGLAVLSRKSGITIVKIIRNWAPIIIVLLAYENLGNLVHFVNPHDADPVMKRIDEFIFGGVNPTLWLEGHIHPWLSEIMHIAYVNYYPFLPIIGFVLYISRDFHRFRNVMVSVTFGFYLGYIGYILLPTVGPRYYMADLFTLSVKGTTMMSDKVYEMLNALESTRRDCFPSLHTAISVIVTVYAYRYRRWLFWFMAPVCTGIVCATIYLRYHYVIDVIAGLAHAAFCVWLGPRVNALWYRYVTGDHVAADYPETLDLFDKGKTVLAKITGRFGKR
ncbi:phosphatase PAP2 family protein [bacterium]|nr:phosphatase PAP2 family protein [bacterium]